MKVIVDINNKTLKMLENERSIFKGEYNADKLTLYINKNLENEYPVITALLSNGRKIGGYTTDDVYGYEVIDGVEYTTANFTLSKENGFTLSEGTTQVTIWIYKIQNSEVVSKTAIGNVIFNVVNTTAYDDGDVIISGNVEETTVNLKVELENLQGKVENLQVNLGNYQSQGFNLTRGGYSLKANINDGYFTAESQESSTGRLTPEGLYIKTFENNKTWYNYNNIVKYDNETGKEDTLTYPKKSGVFALIDDIPTNTSQLINDSDYAKKTELFSKNYNDLTNKPTIPTKTSQLNNDSGYITNAVDNLVNYYKKKEVKDLVSSLAGVKMVVVDELPDTNIVSNTIYLKLSNSTKENNIYEEYIYINNAWELIGTTAVDLTNYATKDEIPTKLSELEKDVEFGVSDEDVLNIIEENAEQTTTLDVEEATEIAIGTSETFNAESDEQVPTSKAVSEFVASAGGGSLVVDMGTYTNDSNEEALKELFVSIKNKALPTATNYIYTAQVNGFKVKGMFDNISLKLDTNLQENDAEVKYEVYYDDEDNLLVNKWFVPIYSETNTFTIYGDDAYFSISPVDRFIEFYSEEGANFSLSSNGMAGTDAYGNSYNIEWKDLHWLTRKPVWSRDTYTVEDQDGTFTISFQDVYLNTNFPIYIEIIGEDRYEDIWIIFKDGHIELYDNNNGEYLDATTYYGAIDGFVLGGDEDYQYIDLIIGGLCDEGDRIIIDYVADGQCSKRYEA